MTTTEVTSDIENERTPKPPQKHDDFSELQRLNAKIPRRVERKPGRHRPDHPGLDQERTNEIVEQERTNEIVEAFKSRGKLFTKFGVARLGIEDLEQALAAEPKNLELIALLGDAKRVYARDVLLGGGLKSRAEVIEFVGTECVQRFQEALAGMPTSSAPWRAWLHAHLAASYTLIVSMAPAQTEDQFQEGKRHFEAARVLHKKYAWAIQFEAFLYAVHGNPADFKEARRLLHELKTTENASHLQSSIDRSLSMLYSYDTDAQSLVDSVTFGLAAASRDSQDPFALYFAGASMLRLAQQNVPPNDEVPVESAMATLESARIRATNAISQATALLAAIASLQGKDEVTRNYLSSFAKAPRNLEAAPDLETLSMMSRDHTWDKYREHPDFKRLMEVGVAPRKQVWWTI